MVRRRAKARETAREKYCAIPGRDDDRRAQTGRQRRCRRRRPERSDRRDARQHDARDRPHGACGKITEQRRRQHRVGDELLPLVRAETIPEIAANEDRAAEIRPTGKQCRAPARLEGRARRVVRLAPLLVRIEDLHVGMSERGLGDDRQRFGQQHLTAIQGDNEAGGRPRRQVVELDQALAVLRPQGREADPAPRIELGGQAGECPPEAVRARQDDVEARAFGPVEARPVEGRQIRRACSDGTPGRILRHRREADRPAEIYLGLRPPADDPRQDGAARLPGRLPERAEEKARQPASPYRFDLEVEGTAPAGRADFDAHGAGWHAPDPMGDASDGARTDDVGDRAVRTEEAKHRPHRLVPEAETINDLDETAGAQGRMARQRQPRLVGGARKTGRRGSRR